MPDRPLRLAVTTGAYTHIADGVSLTLNRLVGYLVGRGVRVEVLAPVGPANAVEPAGTLVPVPSITAPGRPDYRVALGLTRSARRALGAFRPDVLNVSTPDLLGLGARRWALRRGVPVVGIYHTHFASYLDFYGLQRLEPLLWRYLRWFYRPFAQVFVPTHSMAKVLRENGFGDNLTVWGRGIETDRFAPEKRDLAWRRALGFADDDVVVTWVGRLVLEKGLDVFAAMVEAMQARGLSFKTLVVGDGPERAAFEQRLVGAVFTGTLRGDDLPRAYASSDVFVFPSVSEAFGNVTLEAMACGLPAVCARAPGASDLVVEGETGFLVPPGQAEAFADAAAQLVQDAALRLRMGEAARARALTFRWDVLLGQMYDALHSLAFPTR